MPLPLNFVDIQFLRLQGVCPFAGAPSFFAPLTGARAFLYPKRCSRKTWGRCLWRKDTSPKPPPETWGRSNFAPTPPNGQKGRACGPLPFGNPTPGLLFLHPNGVGESKGGGVATHPPLSRCGVRGEIETPRVSLQGVGGRFSFQKRMSPRSVPRHYQWHSEADLFSLTGQLSLAAGHIL